MLDHENLVQLAIAAAEAKGSASYSFNNEKFSGTELNATLAQELNELAGTYSLYRENKNRIFSLIESVVDEVIPKKVEQQYSVFAEIKSVPQGDKAVFKTRITAASKRRAKRFITRVGLAGVYEVFKLDGSSFEVPVTAIGGAAQVGIEEMLDNRFLMSDFLEIVMEGIDEAIYREIHKALEGCIGSIQPANKETENGFSEIAFDRLLTKADAYGKSVIYCSPEFATKIKPQNPDWAPAEVKSDLWNKGWISTYKGHTVVVFDQSFTDESNTELVINPKYVYIMPAGADKPVKMVFEGATLVREVENHDWSREMQVYRKFGVGIRLDNNLFVYEDTTL